jgi:6-phosphofructokinase
MAALATGADWFFIPEAPYKGDWVSFELSSDL